MPTPNTTSAATARVPCRPSQASAQMGAVAMSIGETVIGIAPSGRAAVTGACGENEHTLASRRAAFVARLVQEEEFKTGRGAALSMQAAPMGLGEVGTNVH